MEQTRWKQSDLLMNFSDCETVGELIPKIEDFFQQKGELVCELLINGISLREEDEVKFQCYKISEIEELVVKTNTQSGLTSESIKSLQTVLIEIEEDMIVASEYFRMMDFTVKAQLKFDQGIKKSQLATHLTTLLLQSNNQTDLSEVWRVYQARFIHLCNQIQISFQNKNYVLVADLLEYEFSNFIQDWKNWISSQFLK